MYQVVTYDAATQQNFMKSNTACRVSSHFLSACRIGGFRHPVSFLQSLHESEGISSWEWTLTSTEDLPHCHTIGPLQRHMEGGEGCDTIIILLMTG